LAKRLLPEVESVWMAGLLYLGSEVEMAGVSDVAVS